jgi:hypothetical protein
MSKVPNGKSTGKLNWEENWQKQLQLILKYSPTMFLMELRKTKISVMITTAKLDT